MGKSFEEARELAFDLVKLDPNLQKPLNKDIKEVFCKKILTLLRKFKVNLINTHFV